MSALYCSLLASREECVCCSCETSREMSTYNIPPVAKTKKSPLKTESFNQWSGSLMNEVRISSENSIQSPASRRYKATILRTLRNDGVRGWLEDATPSGRRVPGRGSKPERWGESAFMNNWAGAGGKSPGKRGRKWKGRRALF